MKEKWNDFVSKKNFSGTSEKKIVKNGNNAQCQLINQEKRKKENI